MKLKEGQFDSYINMGMSGGIQDNVSDMGNIDNESRDDGDVGVLSVFVARGILGNLSIEDVIKSDKLSDDTKHSIQDMVDEMGGGISVGSGDNSDSSDIDSDHTYLQEEVKKKIRANFNRFIM